MTNPNTEKPIIIKTSSGGGWAAAIIAAIIVAACAVYILASGRFPGSDTVNINVEAPKAEPPAAPAKLAAEAPAAPAANP